MNFYNCVVCGKIKYAVADNGELIDNKFYCACACDFPPSIIVDAGVWNTNYEAKHYSYCKLIRVIKQ